jgi:hypothetical protein
MLCPSSFNAVTNWKYGCIFFPSILCKCGCVFWAYSPLTWTFATLWKYGHILWSSWEKQHWSYCTFDGDIPHLYLESWLLKVVAQLWKYLCLSYYVLCILYEDLTGHLVSICDPTPRNESLCAFEKSIHVFCQNRPIAVPSMTIALQTCYNIIPQISVLIYL